jgi:hypothetical protein
MKYFNFLTLLLFLSSFSLIAQPNSEDWYKGRVFLRNADTLSSLISYDVVNDVVQVQVGATVQSYTATTVEGFEFLDEKQKQKRVFKAAPFGIYEDNYKVPVFFEVLTKSSGLVLLSKRSHILVPFTNSPLFAKKQYPEMRFKDVGEPVDPKQHQPYLYAKDYKYAIKKKRVLESLYIMTPGGEVKRYTDDTRIWSTFYVKELQPAYDNADKESLLAILSDQRMEIRQFVMENKLSYRKKADLIKIVEYYNRLNRYVTKKQEVKI